MTFGDALDALDADELIQSAMPDEMYKVFRHYKRDEWERYCATVSDWDRERVPRHPPVARALRHRTETHMCGIAGIIYRSGTHDIGKDMIAMLQSMKHRGPDSTGYALYGRPQPDRVVMRYKLADANDPRDFDFQARLREAPGRGRGADRARRRRDRVGRGRDRVRVPGRRPLHRRPEDAGRPGRGRAAAPRCSRSAARSRSSRTSATPRRSASSTRSTSSPARTRSATSGWRPSPTSTSRAPTPTGRTRSPTSRSSTTGS